MTDDIFSTSPDEPASPLADAVAGLSETELAELAGAIEDAVLGDVRKYTRPEIVEMSGVSAEQADELWRALGFAIPADDDIVFSDADAQALKQAFELVRFSFISQENLLAFTRLLGQQMSRVAESQAQWMLERLMTGPPLDADSALPVLIGGLVPIMENLQNHIWRRHSAMQVQRTFANTFDVSRQHMIVGFVDLAGYTNFSRKVGPVELSEELEEFEYLTAYLAAEHHGRVVKSLGDEVLFVADRAEDAAEIALGLVERTEADEHRLPVHVGLAGGEVIPRLGDVFGPVVNLASRLTEAARPGTVLVDRETAAELAEHSAYDLQRVRGMNVRDYPDAGATRLRRHSADERPPRDLGPLEIVRRLRIWE